MSKLEVPGTVQYGRILHGSSMEQYCYARLGYRIKWNTVDDVMQKTLAESHSATDLVYV